MARSRLAGILEAAFAARLGVAGEPVRRARWGERARRELGLFARLFWNEGRTQNWMFTEMDRAVSAGLSLRGLRWGRPFDTVGLASNVGWISEGRRRYLDAGGIGFITGDGRLTYGPEWITELFYCSTTRWWRPA